MSEWTRDKTQAKLQWAMMVDELIEEAAMAKTLKMTEEIRKENQLLRNLLHDLKTILRSK